MIGYQTHQRNQLISFFEAHPNETFTIDEITEKLRDQLGQDAPSRSTVYRTVAEKRSCSSGCIWRIVVGALISIAINMPVHHICIFVAKNAMRWFIWTQMCPMRSKSCFAKMRAYRWT